LGIIFSRKTKSGLIEWHPINEWLVMLHRRKRVKNSRAAKRLKKSERRCIIDDDIDDYNFERIRDNFTALRIDYQEYHGRAYDDWHRGDHQN
jgi:hypothetical protein